MGCREIRLKRWFVRYNNLGGGDNKGGKKSKPNKKYRKPVISNTYPEGRCSRHYWFSIGFRSFFSFFLSPLIFLRSSAGPNTRRESIKAVEWMKDQSSCSTRQTRLTYITFITFLDIECWRREIPEGQTRPIWGMVSRTLYVWHDIFPFF